jgi:hypothetical protein
MPEFQASNYEVMCEINECINYNVKIIVVADASNPHVICGPCGNEITHVIPA